MADLLEEDAVHLGANGPAGPGGIDGDRRGTGRRGRGGLSRSNAGQTYQAGNTHDGGELDSIAISLALSS